ncbi:hypothetical protein HJFPF1_08277 [Paramyrothecium foliicola]|nr:hypothetical protein HJFPF1_08277 [Paramyrothecium foliicola]
MDTLNQSIFPLAGVTRDELRNLCRVLWRWELCEDCSVGKDCRTAHCPWQQSTRLEPFFSYYRETTASYVPDLLPGSVPSLRNHGDLLAVIRAIKEFPQIRRSVLTETHFAQKAAARGETALPLLADQNRAFSLAARIITMVNSSVENQSDGLLESGALPVTWQSDTSFSDFIQAAFPAHDEDDHQQDNPRQQLVPARHAEWAELTAKRLKRVAGLDLIPTDNLQNHLRLDLKYKTVEIYHYTSVLKEHLVVSLKDNRHNEVARGITEGNIPRDLALETLVTLKEILFPLDSESQSMLRSFVSKKGLDPDCVRVDSRPYRRTDENAIPLRYWNLRLADLYDQIEHPTPSGFFERWMERRSGARYVMMATLGGVLIAVVLGALSLAVGIFQAWVAYQQWKHPVSN